MRIGKALIGLSVVNMTAFIVSQVFKGRLKGKEKDV
jgi:hypothetical protein